MTKKFYYDVRFSGSKFEGGFDGLYIEGYVDYDPADPDVGIFEASLDCQIERIEIWDRDLAVEELGENIEADLAGIKTRAALVSRIERTLEKRLQSETD